jgi:thiamine transporter
VVAGITGRFLMHFVSGVVFFGIYAPEGMNPLVYSAIYNGSYLIPELVISGVMIYMLQKSKVLKIYL